MKQPRPWGCWAELAALCAVLVFLLVGRATYTRYRKEQALKTWKKEALSTLAALSISNDLIRTELHQISNPTTNVNFGWTHEHVIKMTNGECLFYAYRHGFPHVFFARGTDNHWYSSSYHFCNRMAMISSEDPAGSIQEFAQRYSLRPFQPAKESASSR